MLKQNYILYLLIGWLLSLTTLENSEALPLTMNLTQDVKLEMNPMEMFAKPSNARMEMRLFPMNKFMKPKEQSEANLDVYSGPATKQIQFFAQPQEDTKAADSKDGSIVAADDAGGAGKAGNATTKAGEVSRGMGPKPGVIPANEEQTIRIPFHKKNAKGEWVYHVWPTAYGKVWYDTRLHNKGGFYTVPRISIDSEAPRRYYPDGKLSTVCVEKSTVYNVPKVKTWLLRAVYNHTIQSRPIFTDLREQLFKQGESEICHNKDATKFTEFFECSIRRHMRMEYLIPKYPLHQLGYRGFYTKLAG